MAFTQLIFTFPFAFYIPLFPNLQPLIPNPITPAKPTSKNQKDFLTHLEIYLTKRGGGGTIEARRRRDGRTIEALQWQDDGGDDGGASTVEGAALSRGSGSGRFGTLELWCCDMVGFG
ncbi:hypothetical protein Salat_1109700 [Sesamum alatum]|uniref:Uncharacterized protein n=1 Tax=Sesamum alatum TaxID=300844 RepID=A0AAE2CTE4_9LAMI|nr:hypothetical protein Salat_1109700 [Sesamum alatum]